MGSIVVVHPFHPLAGQRLPVLFGKRRTGVLVLVCEGGPRGRVTLPESWTDQGPPPVSVRLSVEGLVELDTLTRILCGG